MKKSIKEIAELDGRYSLRAFEFVQEGLGRTVKKHYGDVTGKQLCYSLAEFASGKWGRMAKVVLNQLGIKSTNDFGNIVYIMVENKWMHARPEDTIEEFDSVYDFEEIFEKNYQFSHEKHLA
jgi:uncharacterized repeat protein (TIGR04138 family)